MFNEPVMTIEPLTFREPEIAVSPLTSNFALIGVVLPTATPTVNPPS
jgi:hypothetical protein